ncbi:MAG: CotH kinase family protein, partial [Treponema sp.]|nr:CotH kinase family protein [Treponema sp.]
DLRYQWYSVQDGESEGSAIENETSTTLKIRTEHLGKTGYYCVVTNTIGDNGDGGKKVAEAKSATIWIDAVYLKDIVSAPEFTVQPQAMNIAPYNRSIELSCAAESAQGNVSYRWYESADGTSAAGTAVTGGTSATLTTPAFTEKGIRYFYCVATVILSADEDEEIKCVAAVSDVVSVACTGLPVVQIDTVDGEEPTCDYVSCPPGENGAGITNATKVPSRMKIFKFGENSAIYDSGEYVKKESGLTVKIRGNTSAYSAKKPYKLKLQKKADLLENLLGRTEKKYKDKEWLLLKDGTSLNTFVGMTVADIAGTPWTPEFAYVNVVINGSYRGVYMLIEAISQSEGRIDVADDGYIIERDAYWWNEDVYFATGLNQKYTFKYPDDEDITQEQIDFIQDYMNALESHVKDGTYEDYIDTESFARWQLIHDILGTWDSEGSNIYMSKYDSTTEENPYEDGTWSKITMSTPWDFDSNYRMVDRWANVHNGAQIYANRLFTSENTAFLDSYKAQWTALSASLWSELSSKLEELKSELGEDINFSRRLDALRWGTGYSTVEANITTAEDWFTSRTSWLDNAINGL